jgi:hypothetical protein
MKISDARAFPVAVNVLADGMKQMRLAQADAAVKEERVIGFAGCLGDGERGGVGKVIVIANNKGFERVLGIKTKFTIAPCRSFVAEAGGFCCFRRCWRKRSGGVGISAGNFEFYLQLAASGDSQGILQQAEVIVLKPDFAEFVGHFQSDVVGIHRTGSQWSKPHIVSVCVQLGTEMFPRRIPNFFC